MTRYTKELISEILACFFFIILMVMLFFATIVIEPLNQTIIEARGGHYEAE